MIGIERRGHRRDATSAADDEARPDPRLDPARAAAGGEGDDGPAVERSVLPLLADGTITVPIADQLPLDGGAPGRYERFPAGGKLGKIILAALGGRSARAAPGGAAAGSLPRVSRGWITSPRRVTSSRPSSVS